MLEHGMGNPARAKLHTLDKARLKSTRVLVVDDYAPFRNILCSTLHKQSGLRVIGEASDGLEAVQKAQELQPDLILLDVSLPALSGIEATRRIRELTIESKILILSEYRTRDFVEEALLSGANGYLIKSNTAIELLLAVESILEGKLFVSASLAGDHAYRG